MNIKIYGIDRDNGDGRCMRRYVIERLGPASINYTNERGLVTHTDSDAGLVGTLVIPMGTQVEDDMLTLPDGTRLSASEAVAAARNWRAWHRIGLELIPARAEP